MDGAKAPARRERKRIVPVTVDAAEAPPVEKRLAVQNDARAKEEQKKAEEKVVAAEGAAAEAVLSAEAYRVHTNDAIFLRMCAGRADVEDFRMCDKSNAAETKKYFHPSYTHQTCSLDEVLRGYRGYRCDVLFGAASLRSYIHSEWREVQDTSVTGVVVDEDPKECIKRQLPEFAQPCEDLDVWLKDLDEKESEFVPPGERVFEKDGFEMFYCDVSTQGVGYKYNQMAQIFVLLFIDASSYIDATEPGWRGYFLFETREGVRRLIGFTTAYEYYHYPDQVRLRVSQSFVFPPYQRRGLGLLMLQGIYQHMQKRPEVYDITVEDPSDDFAAMRDLCDVLAVYNSGVFQSPDAVLTPELGEQLRERLKISKAQILRSYLTLKYEHGKRLAAQGSPDLQSEMERRIKNTILSKYADWFEDCKTAPERKAMLVQIYGEKCQEYDLVLAAMHRRIDKKA